jgi:hypothetical protein
MCLSLGESRGADRELLEIPLDDGDEVVGGLQLRGEGLLAWDENVKPDLAFDQFRHQPVESPSARSDELKNFLALVLFSGKGSLNGFDLTLDAPDPA